MNIQIDIWTSMILDKLLNQNRLTLLDSGVNINLTLTIKAFKEAILWRRLTL